MIRLQTPPWSPSHGGVEDKVFYKYAFEICRDGNTFYVVDESEANPIVYKVPWNLVPEFEKIIETALERAEILEY